MDSVCNEELEKLNKGNIRIINRDDEDFPQKLKEIHNPPKRLYIRGNLDGSINLNNKNIAIVGSRNMSTYGKEMARKLARDLSKAGVNIISGLAKGIDSQAHKGALEAGGYTVGVLGCGINVTYPRENIDLYTEIDKKGCIISEYGLDVKSFPGNFPMRNRIISALSDGVIVVEAKRKSGSLITAEYALEQGKQVYAVPGRAYDSNSEGTNNLLKMGALCVTSADDVLWDLMGGEMCRNANNFIDKEDDSKKDDLLNNRGDMNDIEKMIYDFLDLEPKYIDDIIQKSGIGITNTISTLYIMEEKNIIKQPVKGYYIISI
ncbi:MAG: DNA-protecting protein DprA [Lachnospiraceae bacterium]|nr:DNA-protecting protein DprA [Lachnospiraceae bacterium]